MNDRELLEFAAIAADELHLIPYPVIGGIFFGIVGAFVLYLWCTV